MTSKRYGLLRVLCRSLNVLFCTEMIFLTGLCGGLVFCAVMYKRLKECERPDFSSVVCCICAGVFLQHITMFSFEICELIYSY